MDISTFLAGHIFFPAKFYLHRKLKAARPIMTGSCSKEFTIFETNFVIVQIQAAGFKNITFINNFNCIDWVAVKWLFVGSH